MAALRSICVYCGAAVGKDRRYRALAQRLGTILAERGLTLVFGGGKVGLMGALADAALEAGGRVIGVIPTRLRTVELAHQGCTELVVVESMHARKERMYALADAFVALPGGIGTLEETIEMITWRQLGFHDKPIAVVNDGGYWEPLRALFAATVAAGFAHDEIDRLVTFVDSAEAAVTALESSPEPQRRGAPTGVL
ncbi:MAG TPA: TIGR00730 family Rossman fold protein [Alphaproteobacteria bacterium]|nr:TIGR00730 family Rossman fold protein [Alphaproteobacteria bacterium]